MHHSQTDMLISMYKVSRTFMNMHDVICIDDDDEYALVVLCGR